jgi:hypothetical protein
MATTTSTPPLNGETLISLCQAASRYPGHRGADRLHPATLTRWILRGVRALDGQRVRLEAIRVGCRWLTSEAALARFAATLGATNDVTPPRSPASRSNAAEDAGRELEEMGA